MSSPGMGKETYFKSFFYLRKLGSSYNASSLSQATIGRTLKFVVGAEKILEWQLV
jgi:hypothetical protein